MHVRGLQIHRHHDAEPDRIDAGHFQQRRRDDRHHHENDLERIHHEAEQEHAGHHREDRAAGAARQIAERLLHHVVAAKAAEDEAEQRGADQDEKDHAGDLGRACHHRHEQLFRARAPRREQDGADRADGGRFRRRCQAAEDRAEHRKDQQDRRDQDGGEPANERKAARRRGIGRHRGRACGEKDRDADQVEDIERDQREARHDGAREQVGDRNRIRREISLLQLRSLIGMADLVAEQHQHRRGRKDLRQRRGRRDRAGREPLVVAEAQHRRQHDQAHGHRGGADDAFCRSQQHADDRDRDAEAAGQRAEQPAHGLQQLFGNARALEHHAHEDEQRNRQQHIVGHDAEDALRQRAKEREVHHAGQMSGNREGERDAGERERDRIANHQQRAHCDHHGDGEGLPHGSALCRRCGEHPRGADRLRDALQRHQDGEEGNQRLEEIDEWQAAGLSRERSKISHDRAT